jgi:hypothetical protein
LTVAPSGALPGVEQVRITSKNITITPGASYGLSMNVATDAPDILSGPRIFLHCRELPAIGSNSGVRMNKAGMPLDGDGWKQVFTVYHSPAIAAAVPDATDGSTTVNFHYKGAELFLQFAAAGTASGDVNIWVDNIYFYQLSGAATSEMEDNAFVDADISVGNTDIDMGLLTTIGGAKTPLMGDFEAATLEDTGWAFGTLGATLDTNSGRSFTVQPAAAKWGDFTASTGTYALNSTYNHTPKAGATRCFALQLPGGSSRTEHKGMRYVVNGIHDDNQVPDVGTYTVEAYMQSDAAVMADVPIFTLGMTTNAKGNFNTHGFTTIAFTVAKGPAVPFGSNNVINSGGL